MLAPRKAGESFGTVSRTAALLRVMAEHGEVTLKEMSSIVGLAPSTCHHLLDLLRREGLCERLPDRRGYRIGSELFRIAAQVHAKHDVRAIADKFLHEVVAACDETCLLGIYLPIDRKMMFASKVDSSRALRYTPMMNVPLSVLWGASGRSILAHLPKPEVDLIYASEGTAPGSSEARPSRTRLERELVLIRDLGFAISKGQKIAGAVGISAPVFGSSGQVIGNLSVTIPEVRMRAKYDIKLGKLLANKATQLSGALGAPASTGAVERKIA